MGVTQIKNFKFGHIVKWRGKKIRVANKKMSIRPTEIPYKFQDFPDLFLIPCPSHDIQGLHTSRTLDSNLFTWNDIS